MRTCSYPDCRHAQSQRQNNCRMHKFPADETRCQEWMVACDIEGSPRQLRAAIFLCSCHFTGKNGPTKTHPCPIPFKNQITFSSCNLSVPSPPSPEFAKTMTSGAPESTGCGGIIRFEFVNTMSSGSLNSDWKPEITGRGDMISFEFVNTMTSGSQNSDWSPECTECEGVSLDVCSDPTIGVNPAIKSSDEGTATLEVIQI